MANQARLAPYELTWLTSPASATVVDEFAVERQPYQLPPEVGNAWVESLVLHDGIVLFRAVHELEPSPAGQLVHLMDASFRPDEPVFNAQIWISGICCHREYWHGGDHPPVDIIARPGHDTFRLHQEWQSSILVEGGMTSEMRSVVIPRPMLQLLLHDENIDSLFKWLGLNRSRPTVVRAMPLHVSAPLRAAMAGHVFGPARRLYAQARVLDYLAALLEHVSAEKGAYQERRHKGRIQDLHDYLIHLEGRLPTLTDLAHEFGLSARRLNDEFSLEYGTSIYKFMVNFRLQQAHRSIQSGSTPMKVLATQLGYSHVNHFISAFKREFGYSPGSLRRKKAKS